MSTLLKMHYCHIQLRFRLQCCKATATHCIYKKYVGMAVLTVPSYIHGHGRGWAQYTCFSQLKTSQSLDIPSSQSLLTKVLLPMALTFKDAIDSFVAFGRCCGDC